MGLDAHVGTHEFHDDDDAAGQPAGPAIKALLSSFFRRTAWLHTSSCVRLRHNHGGN